MRFKVWLEEIEKNADFWRRFFLGIWDLAGDHEGLSKNLKGFDTDRLKGTSEFQDLEPDLQQQILNRIAQGNGTVADLVDLATRNISHPMPGISPGMRSINPISY